ncbi:MAG: acyltransferase [Rhodospirillales bacterium 69-11]|mgnify:CR=1 FL=1|nr:MBOAT family protein [Rhodospirillales bacterium]OJW26381.1 MAG: acyltransferase [Rhodospirillales bacterium 69-11]
MLFHSQAFILGFLPVCLGGFFLLGRAAGRVWGLRWLVAASFVFYAWWRPPFVLLLGASIAANYLLGRHLLGLARSGRQRAARLWLAGGVAANLILLGWFKYADFLLQTIAPGAPALHLFLPLAISFFTFQQIMFLVDSARCDRQDTGPLPYAAFIAFFPHLIAGPIVRPKEIIPQLTSPGLARPDGDALSAGLMLFLLGLAKKLVLADTFGGFADRGFDAAAAGEALTFFEAWYAALAYALQIYFDFSGYSDMAIGLARMLNVRFPLNFDSPYQATSITDFWRRWHMTLSRFLRGYLYIPLGGNRAGERRRLVNLMLTMLLGGLWHGAAWTFVLWGGLHGAFLVIHAAWRRRGWCLPRLPAQALTLLAVTLAWVPFRADGMAATWAMLRGMAGANGIALPQMLVRAMPPLGWIATGVPVLPHLGEARTLSFPEVTVCLLVGWTIVLALPNVHAMSERMRGWSLTAGFALSVQALFFAPHVAPFLYFQF